MDLWSCLPRKPLMNWPRKFPSAPISPRDRVDSYTILFLSSEKCLFSFSSLSTVRWVCSTLRRILTFLQHTASYNRSHTSFNWKRRTNFSWTNEELSCNCSITSLLSPGHSHPLCRWLNFIMTASNSRRILSVPHRTISFSHLQGQCRCIFSTNNGTSRNTLPSPSILLIVMSHTHSPSQSTSLFGVGRCNFPFSLRNGYEVARSQPHRTLQAKIHLCTPRTWE